MLNKFFDYLKSIPGDRDSDIAGIPHYLNLPDERYLNTDPITNSEIVHLYRTANGLKSLLDATDALYKKAIPKESFCDALNIAAKSLRGKK